MNYTTYICVRDLKPKLYEYRLRSTEISTDYSHVLVAKVAYMSPNIPPSPKKTSVIRVDRIYNFLFKCSIYNITSQSIGIRHRTDRSYNLVPLYQQYNNIYKHNLSKFGTVCREKT